MSDVPEIKEELERKVTTALAEILQRVSKGVLSSEAAREGLKALWDASSGLVDLETMELVADSIDEIGKVAISRRVAWRKSGNKVVALLMPEKDCEKATVLTFTLAGVSKRDLHSEGDTLSEVSNKANRALSALVENGFKPLNV